MSANVDVVALFFDDVRQEIGGKHSFMGMYQDDLILGNHLNPILQKLFVVFFCRFKRDDSPNILKLCVITPQGEKHEFSPKLSELLAGKPEVGSVVLQVSLGLESLVATPGTTIRAEATINRKVREVGRLNIKSRVSSEGQAS